MLPKLLVGCVLAAPLPLVRFFPRELRVQRDRVLRVSASAEARADQARALLQALEEGGALDRTVIVISAAWHTTARLIGRAESHGPADR